MNQSRGSSKLQTRRTGVEWRAAGWMARHPGWIGAPVAATTGVAELGAATTGGIAAGAALGLLGWYRGHPTSYDTLAGAYLRAQRRRWLAYVGRRWADTMRACELTRENKRTGQAYLPRITRVRSATPSLDTVYVRIPKGLSARAFEEKADELADALRAERVAVARHRPAVVALVIERCNPFGAEPLPAPEIPGDPEDVDLTAVDVGETELGDPLLLNLYTSTLVVGRSGAGKGSIMWGQLRGIGPMIRDGLVRVRMIDLKGGMETERGKALFYRHATDMEQAEALIDEALQDMRDRQEWLRLNGARKFTLSQQTPLDLVVVDELAMLTALGDASVVRRCVRKLGILMTQGRAPGTSVQGFIQEPTKDILPVRDLFNRRICLGVTAESHVDMALGDGMRQRGALADRIPDDAESLGTGFTVLGKQRMPRRIRAGWVTDEEIDELTASCAPRAHLAPVRDLPAPQQREAVTV